MAQPGDEDISPYATFHLLGMREENKNGMMNPQAYKTMPHPPGQMQQPQQQQPGPGHQTGPNTPAHQRQMAQTMHVRLIQQNPDFLFQFKLFFSRDVVLPTLVDPWVPCLQFHLSSKLFMMHLIAIMTLLVTWSKTLAIPMIAPRICIMAQ